MAKRTKTTDLPPSSHPEFKDFTLQKAKELIKSNSYSLDTITKEIAPIKEMVNSLPGLVSEEIQKSWKQLPNAEAKRSPKGWYLDPLSLQYSLGYRERKYSLSYDILNRMASQSSIINAIINTRTMQIASFCQPYRTSKSLGFIIKHKDPEHPTTAAEVAFIKELESFVMNCGRAEKNPYSRVRRDDLDSWVRKIVRQSLVYDQVCAEIVYDKLKIPYEFYALDAATIRLASDDRYVGVNNSYTERQGFVPDLPMRWAGLYEGQQYGSQTADGERVAYVQLLNGQIENIFSENDLMWGVRNPRSDIQILQYGLSESESIMNVITAHLWAEEYNRNIFKNGASNKGVLNLKGDNWSPEMLEDFKRQWTAQVTGVQNAHKVAVLQSEGVEWIDFQTKNREMDFMGWLEYNIKLCCSVYQIDPAELNFDVGGGVSQQPLFESSSEWKLQASKDRGLKPLLKFVAKLLNKYIIDKIDDHFTLEFVGLDEMSEQEKHELLVEQIASYMTLNEARRSLDLPELPGGDLPMNGTYLQALELQNNLKNGVQNGSTNPDSSPSGVGADNADVPKLPPGGSKGQTPLKVEPKYSATFGKAIKD